MALEALGVGFFNCFDNKLAFDSELRLASLLTYIADEQWYEKVWAPHLWLYNNGL